MKPKLQVFKSDGQLLPVTPYDVETIEDMPQQQLFELTPVSKRSNPHHKLYWVTLGRVVKQTGSWATSGHLHDDLKMLCGHYRSVLNKASGGIYYIPDSTAYKNMDQAQFAKYFEQAMAKLSETIGYDPLEFTE